MSLTLSLYFTSLNRRFNRRWRTKEWNSWMVTPLSQMKKKTIKKTKMMMVIAVAIRKVMEARMALLSIVETTVLTVIVIRTQVEITLKLGRISRSAILKRKMARISTLDHLQTKRMTKMVMIARNKRMI